MPDINKQQIDIENLFKQNENDLSSIKELYKRIEELGEKITQIKYIDSTLAKKLKKEYESLKKLIIDENVSAYLDNKIDDTKAELNNNIGEISSQLDNKIDDTKAELNINIGKISSQLDNKANQSDLLIEKSRIDNFVSLPNGSTTGDAELIDGRIGINSITYDNIGTAIREQIKPIANELLYNAQTKLKLISGYVTETGEFIATPDYKIVSTPKAIINDTLNIKFMGSDEIQCKISYYNVDGSFIRSTDYFVLSDLVVGGGKNIILTFKRTDSTAIQDSSFYKVTKTLTKKIEQNVKSKNIDGKINLLEGLTCYEGKNIIDKTDLVDFSVSSILTDSSVAYTYEPIKIRDGNELIYENLTLSTVNTSNVRQVLYYDVNGYHISTFAGVSSSQNNKNYELDIPSNAFYVVIVGYTNFEVKDSFSLKIPTKKIEWLDVTDQAIVKRKTTGTSLYSEKATPGGSDSIQLDIYKYPIYPAWGHEYLNSWYEKLFNNENVVISVDGDSTTEEGMYFWTGVNGRRVDMIKKIMCTIGKYPTDKITIHKNGYGARTTGTYVGAFFNPTHPSDVENYPNGTLDLTMQQNPDLIVFGYGINDASTNLFPDTTIQERLDQSKAWLEEALKRIRGNVSVNGRPSYNKSADELAIILCTPIQAENGTGRGRDNWQQYQRQIFMELARTYHCAFYDVTARHYDHKFSKNWSQNNSTNTRTPDSLHPTPWTNADIFSGIQDLLFPLCLWKW